MELGFIQSKVNIPKTKDKIVKRKTLFNKLDGALSHKLTVISAPAGFGKSTLLASWLRIHAEDEFLISWVSFDETDKDSSAFWKYVLYSINETQKGSVENSFSMLRSLQIHDDFNKSFLAMLLGELSNLDKNLLIIMDDLHLAANETIDDDLRFFIKNLPDNIHLMISSRTLPDIGLAKLRAQGDLLEICEKDLAFSQAETQYFFHRIMDINLSEKALKCIAQRTEGWVAGLLMAALFLKGNHNETDLVKYFNGGHRYVLEYLMDEVFQGIDEKVRDFLTKSAIVDEMCAGLCNAILDRENSQQILEELDKNHLFVIPLDEAKQWYRYHHLFREFLIRTQLSLNTAALENIFCKAARWYEKNHSFSQAISMYLKAPQYEEAAAVIEKIDIQIMFNDEMKQVYEWCKVLPQNLIYRNSKFCIDVAWFNCVNGDQENTEFYLKQAETSLECLTDNGLKKDYLAETMIIRAWSASLKLDTIEIKKYLDTARDYSGRNKLLKALILLLNGVISIYDGEINPAIAYFDETLKISNGLQTYFLSVMANTNIILSKLFCGRLYECERQCVSLLQYYRERYGNQIPLTGAVLNDLATIYYEWNQLDKATEYAEKALELGKKGDIAWIRARSYNIIGKIYFAHADIKKAVQYIKKAEQDMLLDKSMDVSGFIERAKTEMLIKTGKLNEAAQWIENNQFNFDPPNLFYHLLEAKLLFYQGSSLEAEKLLMKIYKIAEKNQGYKILAEIFILWGAVHYQKGLPERTADDLSQAINISCQEKYIRIFLNEGAPLKRIFFDLKEKIENHLTENGKLFFREILEEFKISSQLEKPIMANVLSEREIEIIRCIKNGLTNMEISKMLYVSPNTVKTHLFNIYAKLNVHSRTKALIRAEELNIIK